MWFGDIASHDFDDYDDETVPPLRSRTAVTAAHCDDRELITVSGTVDAEALEPDIRGWWTAKLRGEART